MSCPHIGQCFGVDATTTTDISNRATLYFYYMINQCFPGSSSLARSICVANFFRMKINRRDRDLLSFSSYLCDETSGAILPYPELAFSLDVGPS